MFGRISNTWGLMGDSWRILKQDKELLLFPLIQSALQVIFQTALYYYAKHQTAPAGFDAATLGGAMYRR